MSRANTACVDLSGVTFRSPADGNSLADLLQGMGAAMKLSMGDDKEGLYYVLRVSDAQQIKNLANQVEAVRITLLDGVAAMAALAAEAETIADADRESFRAVRHALLLVQELVAAVAALDTLADIAAHGRPMPAGGPDAP